MNTDLSATPEILVDEQLRRLEDGGLIPRRRERASSLQVIARAVREASDRLSLRRAV